MATVICPNCGAVGNAGSICEFCGTTISQKQTEITRQTTPDSKTEIKSETNKVLVGEVFITPNQAIEKVKSDVEKRFRDISKKDYYEEYWRIINPTIEKLKLFNYTLELYYIPVWVYSGECKVRVDYDARERYLRGKNYDDEITSYCYTIFAGEYKKYPIDLVDAVNYKYNNSVIGETSLTSKFSPNIFRQNPEKCWESVRGKEMRRNLRDCDTPNIEYVMVPLFLVKVSIGDVSRNVVVNSVGDILSAAGYENIIAESQLGKDYNDIIKAERNKRYNREEKEEERHKAEKQIEENKKNEKKELKETILAILIVVGIIALIGGLCLIPMLL